MDIVISPKWDKVYQKKDLLCELKKLLQNDGSRECCTFNKMTDPKKSLKITAVMVKIMITIILMISRKEEIYKMTNN